MKKKWLVALSSLFIISLIGGVVAVSAAQNSDFPGFHMGNSIERSQERLAELQADATALGISTEGKDVPTLRKEVYEAKTLAEAKALGITTEGIAIKDLRAEIREARTLAKAAELGVATEGKDIDALHEEIRDLERAAAEAKVLKAATDLGITTDNKTHRQLVLEIKEKFPTEFDALGLNGPGPGGFGGHGSRGGFCGQGNINDSESFRGQGVKAGRGGRGGPNNYAPVESVQAPSA